MSKLGWLIAPVAAVAFLAAPAVAQEPATVTGRVTNTAGAPEAAVMVRIVSLSVGTTTAQDGSYRLVVPAARIRAGQSVSITASRVGLGTVSRQATLSPGASLTQNFQMAADALMLEELVAVGIGQAQTRERLGVSISSVRGEDLTRTENQNVVNLLAAKAPGIEITSSAGDPGASSSITIRGVKTVGLAGFPNAQQSGQPLFVVDGVPIINSEAVMPSSVNYGEDSDLAGSISTNRASDINPDDIASIEILKGAAASAIYGARAANGVVLITTKSGQAGPTRISLRTTMSFDEVNRAVPLQTSFGHGTGGVNNGAGLRSWGGPITQGFDHWGELFETGQLIDTDFSLSGGTDRTSYYMSLGRTDHDGVITGSNDFYDKTTARLRAAHDMGGGFRLTGNFAYTDVDASYIQKGSNLSGLLLGGLRTPPDFNNNPYLDEDGNHRSYAGVFDNPFFTINENRATSQVGRSFGNVGLDYAPTSWAKLNYTLGLDYSNDNRLDVLPIGNLTYTPGYLGRAQFLNKQTTHSVTGTVTRELRTDLSGSLVAGYSREARQFDRFFVEGQDFIAPGVFTLDNTVTRTPNEFHSRVHVESFFGQGQVDVADQLFLTAAVRNDGFSTFGASERRHWYPKLSAAWEFTQTLGTPAEWLQFGKLRAAWGQAGNEPPVYGTIFGFVGADVDSGWNDFLRQTLGGAGGLVTDFIKPQENLRPERTTEFEAGADFGLLGSRASLGFTYYNAQTKDAILLTPLPPSTGFTRQLTNVAEIRNRGWEVTLDLRVIERPNFSWSVGGNWSTNDNEVLSLGDVTFVDMGGFVGTAAVVGFPVGVMYANDFYRCGNLAESWPADIQNACQGASPDAVYVGADGKPRDDPERRVVGDPTPDWTAGLRSSLRLFNNIQLSGLLDFKQGGDVWNGTRGALYSYGTHADTEIRGASMTWSEWSGDETVGPGAGTPFIFNEAWFRGLGGGFGAVERQFVEDGSYVKLREIALDWTAPSSIARRLGMGSLGLRLAGRNLKTWTDYTGIDPETNLTGTSPLRGQDYFNNPQTRQFSISVSLTR